uniref:hypothetical protein n=1 Tax=uncultured Gimesia sp. TaxID=1678688 RepID=UPI00260BE51E
DWQREKIGLKYNEGWLKDMNQFGYKSGRYCPVIESADAIIASWAKGSSVPPLAVQLPDTPIRKYKTVDTPMIPTGRLKAVVLFDQKYKEYFNMKNNKQLLEVTSKGIIHYVIHRREWKIYKDLVEE